MVQFEKIGELVRIKIEFGFGVSRSRTTLYLSCTAVLETKDLPGKKLCNKACQESNEWPILLLPQAPSHVSFIYSVHSAQHNH